MGEGCGVLVLESLDHALARGAPIYAEYLGGGLSCDAGHMTDPRPDGLGVKLCLKRTLEDAGVSQEEVNYINAHATSTQAGDLCEMLAIKEVFGSRLQSAIKVNATKSMTGHALGAAGGIEAIAVIKAIQTGMLHPTINLETPEEALEGIDLVPKVAKPHQVQVALSNSFGFGGHNSCLAFAPYRK
jgi:3-oxoacyl-[acyl-carrier-protein] synthase II